MEHVLCNTYKLNEPWLFSYLEEFLNKDAKVLFLVIDEYSSYSEEMVALEEKYESGKREYEALVMPLESYHIKRDNIDFIFLHDTSLADLKNNINKYDALIIYGNGNIYGIEDVLYECIKDFEGLYIGINEGALIALDEYYHYEEEYESFEGIGLLSGFSIDICYKDRENHIANIIRFMEENDKDIVAFRDSGSGIILNEGYMELLGDAFILKEDDIDELYQALDTLRMW